MVAVIAAMVRHRERVLMARTDRLAREQQFHRQYATCEDEDGVLFVPWDEIREKGLRAGIRITNLEPRRRNTSSSTRAARR